MVMIIIISSLLDFIHQINSGIMINLAKEQRDNNSVEIT